jgi:hypothetical protein
VASGLEGQSATLFTEDLQGRRRFGDLPVRNPCNVIWELLQ